jgi:hypothetical protein
MPAPVLVRRSFTSVAVISAMSEPRLEYHLGTCCFKVLKPHRFK